MLPSFCLKVDSHFIPLLSIRVLNTVTSFNTFIIMVTKPANRRCWLALEVLNAPLSETCETDVSTYDLYVCNAKTVGQSLSYIDRFSRLWPSFISKIISFGIWIWVPCARPFHHAFIVVVWLCLLLFCCDWSKWVFMFWSYYLCFVQTQGRPQFG